MIHRKTFYQKKVWVHDNQIIIEGPVCSEDLATMEFDEGLKAFRAPKQQQEALVEIADLPEGRIIVARHENVVLAYVTFLHPDPLERWSMIKMDDLLELGAIEVSSKIRKGGIAKQMLEVAFMDDALEDYIILSTEYYWHWDLQGTGLSVWDYRKVMEKLMGSVGMMWTATDDPEICSHPANCLMTRIGKRVPLESMTTFDSMRFQSRYMY
ncbi:GNAT family N-acetyltransferase [Brevibacillus laterosporus]|uniref:Acetoin dehydrogenase n=2 Tax=Brevibacillus TaxID=55080 RepID=A0A0F7EGT4_BRELA|nr:MULTISPECIES: GNAT family N-acetyltransferase [Brevibacillus]AKF94105.1 acetoin dehydrogenase [Brevibacillus laterosporus]MCR8986718.1 N-acetyltransferase [Brevibacillus laterosporus]MCZ0832454.1 N-acetyltransferase [Brevibacillus halotolerans]GIO02733.1 acetoin utilization protein AcuA [Brevibacillus halotolerans]